jgi:hypothetical protein
VVESTTNHNGHNSARFKVEARNEADKILARGFISTRVFNAPPS